MKQTIGSGDPTLALKTTGPLTNMGGFRDVVHRHKPQSLVSFEMRFRTVDTSPPGKRTDIINTPPGRMSVEFGLGDDDSEIILRRFELSDIYDRAILVRKRMANGTFSVTFADKLSSEVEKLITDLKPEHFFFPVTKLFTYFLEKAGQNSRSTKRRRIRVNLPSYFGIVGSAQSEVAQFFSRISYVGPLRKQPKRFYEISGEIPDGVGPQGENAPEILFKRKDQPFVKAITEWVSKFELARAIKCVLLSPGIFAVRLLGKDPGTSVDFADTGFGLSQILPLIVQGFHGKQGDIIIVEQPEIHLNPKLQCALADFFAALVATQKSVIVETHSEHVIMRIRSLVASGVVKPEDVGLYFLERDNDATSVRQIPIHADGFIEPQEWPKGFFEESLREALNLARVGNSKSVS